MTAPGENPSRLSGPTEQGDNVRPHQPCECERCTAYQDGWDEFGRRLAVAMRSMGYEVSPSDNGPSALSGSDEAPDDSQPQGTS